ncbi:MAG: Gfo/Idh/MocA family oxidoreductase [Puniceicoccales bacterium]|jgi:predicted dehydrogenase|nr:Gfo/Idh/MocA family oxidoreductase [Puniceicoccales bacterium]
MSQNTTSDITGSSRRTFIGNCAALTGLSLLSSLPATAFATGGSGSDRLKVGLVGCGGRGVGAVYDCLAADPSVQIWALGDIFADRLAGARRNFEKVMAGEQRHNQTMGPDRFAITDDRCFTGFNAFQGVIDSGIDLVILATPPHFRPQHMEAAVQKGVHIFAEKPVAVDPVGVRRVMKVGELAAEKKLSIVAGTQRRHDNGYQETMQRVLNGDIGELVAGQCYWMGGELWHHGRKPEWTEMEYQIRNWLYFTWLSGDHIVEQHIHNIDIMNWAFGGPPVKAVAMGGRQCRTDPKYGDAWDHFAVEYQYANGVRVQSMCRQTNETSFRVNERLVGTLGTAVPNAITGKNPWKFQGKRNNPMIQEHVDLIASIRNRVPLNEAKHVAESTLTAILGRVSAYTGKEINYNWMLEASKLDLTPERYEFGEAPAVIIPAPKITKLV